MIVPNSDRILVKRIRETNQDSQVLMPGQLTAGENLLVGTVVHPGDTSFKKDQIVYYSEYSASAIRDVGAVLRGEMKMGESMTDANILYVVASDDVMAREEK